MANLSLDDYMGKKNFRVQFQNNKARGNTNTKLFQNKLSLTTKKTFVPGNGLNNRVQKARIGPYFKRTNIKTLGTQNQLRQKQKTVQISGVGKVKTFDARQKLLSSTTNAKKIENDARQKIILSQKQKGTFDARSIIKTKPNMDTSTPPVQQVAITGQGKVKPRNGVQLMGMGGLTKTINNGGVQLGGSGGLTKTIKTGGGVQLGGSGGLRKTLKNEFANGGSSVEMFGNTIQITRSVPNSEVTFDGKNKLTVTKRASAIKESQPFKRSRSPIRWSSKEAPSPSPPKKAHMIKTYKTADAIQRAACKAASERLKILTPTSSPKQPIPVVTSSRNDSLMMTKRRTPTPVVESPKRSVPQPVKTKSVYRPVTVKKEHPDIHSLPSGYDEVEEEDETVDHLLSPLQGFKVAVTNLDPVVSQDDLIELFGAIGALKRAKISRPGLGEVVYVKKEDAQKAALKYHNRELDGLPMQVKLVTPLAARIQHVVPDNDDVMNVVIPDSLKFPKTQTMSSSIVDVPLIHKALFKTGPQVSTKPVTFTVKI